MGQLYFKDWGVFSQGLIVGHIDVPSVIDELLHIVHFDLTDA